MLRQPNLASLWPVVLAEAATLGFAHAVAIVRDSGDLEPGRRSSGGLAA